MADPTNKHVGIAPIGESTEAAARRLCAEAGCTCGEQLEVRITHVATPKESAAREAAGMPAGGKHTDVSVKHRLDCPLLARMGGS